MPTSSAVTRRTPDLTSLAFLAVAFLTGIAGALQTPTLSLFLETEVKVRPALVGVLMGTAAGLEIPIMLIAGMVAKRCGKRCLMRGAAVAGVLFYCGLLFITGSEQLIALQLLNAAFIGVLAGIGMPYFQDLMPGQAGTATTLFTNTIRGGWIIAGAVAEIWNYHAVFYAALAMAAGATLCLWTLREA